MFSTAEQGRADAAEGGFLDERTDEREHHEAPRERCGVRRLPAGGGQALLPIGVEEGIDRELEDGETIELGADLTLTVVATPGHAQGHLAFLLRDADRRVLFSGDALFPGGRILLQDTWDCDLRASLRSVERLAVLAPHALLAGHLGPVLDGASSHIGSAMGRIGRLLAPESLA